MSAQDITPEENPLIAALMKRGFTPQQAQNFAQSSANVASAKGLPPINVKGPPPAAPGLPPPSGTTLSLAQPTERKPIQIAPISSREKLCARQRNAASRAWETNQGTDAAYGTANPAGATPAGASAKG